MGQICPKYTLAWFIICLTLLSVWEIIGMAVKGGPPLDQNRRSIIKCKRLPGREGIGGGNGSTGCLSI